MNAEDVRDLVRQQIKEHAVTNKGKPRKGSTGLTRWCRLNNVTKSHASQFMRGIKPPCTDLLDAVGVTRSYRFKTAGDE